MPIDQYDIFFTGTIIEGQDEAEVRIKVGQIFKASGDKLDRLFSGEPIKIKSGVDLDTASKYRVAFREAGALIDIKPVGSKPSPKPAPVVKPSAKPTPAPAPEQQPAITESEITLSAPNTGSLIDCAEEVTPAPIPNIDNLSMTEANTGSLIDCTQEVEPEPIPDISGISMDNAGAILDETESPPPAEIDTSQLSAEPPNTGSLEDCYQPPEPVEIPDISNMKIAEGNEDQA